MPTLTRLLPYAYPPSWRRRYACELQALLEDDRLSMRAGLARWRTVLDVLANGAAEWLRAGWRSPHRRANFQVLFWLTLEGVGYLWISTMTSIAPDRWMLLNVAFALVLTGATLVRAVAAGWWHGFASSVAAGWIVVALLQSWLRVAGDRLVQSPFDDQTVGVVPAALLMTIVLALIAKVGAVIGRAADRYQESHQ